MNEDYKMAYLPSILEELMSNGYPEIKELRLRFGYFRLKNQHGSSYRHNGCSEILIDTSLEHSKRSVVRGVLSHEISHVIIEEKFSKAEKIEDKRLYKFGLYSELDERNTDLDVVLRGHGTDLLSWKMSEVSRGRNGRTGLTLYEIKKLIGII